MEWSLNISVGNPICACFDKRQYSLKKTFVNHCPNGLDGCWLVLNKSGASSEHLCLDLEFYAVTFRDY